MNTEKSPTRISNALTGKPFAVFTPNPTTGRQDVRFGVVQAQLGPDHYLLEFHANGYAFSNVFALKQLESFVFFGTELATFRRKNLGSLADGFVRARGIFCTIVLG